MTRHCDKACKSQRHVIRLNRLYTLRVKVDAIEELFVSVNEHNVHPLSVKDAR